MKPTAAVIPNRHSTVNSSTDPNVLLPKEISETNDENERLAGLEKCLEVQLKVNKDLKRLLVAASCGNSSIAEELSKLSLINAELEQNNYLLSDERFKLCERVDSAGIAAEIWRSKCLAGKIIASETAKRCSVASECSNSANHALAHMLGEKASLRIALCNTVNTLLSSSKFEKDSVDVNNLDTLKLSRLLESLANKFVNESNNEIKTAVNVECLQDSPAELLAMKVLCQNVDINDSSVKNKVEINVAQNADSIPEVPELSDHAKAGSSKEKFINETLSKFATSLENIKMQHVCFSCKNCKGEILDV